MKVAASLSLSLLSQVLVYARLMSYWMNLMSRCLLKSPPYSLITPLRFHNTSSNPADCYWNLLRNNNNDSSQSNLERTLTRLKPKLDSSIMEQTLARCSSSSPMLLLGALRFFIWAGVQPDYRHANYMYAKACKFFDIGGSNTSMVTDVLEVYKKQGCLVSVKTFKVILNLCREAKLAQVAFTVLRNMPGFDCRPDTTVFNVVIGLFCDEGKMDVAHELMKEMALIDLYPDMSTYMVMIKGFCNVGRLEDACRLLKLMRDHGCVPNVVVFSALLDGFCKVGDLDRAMEFLGEMENGGNGRGPNVVAYTSLIQRFCENCRTQEALAILDRMESRGCFPNRVTVATLIKYLCDEGNIEEAYKLIDRVVANGNVSKSECYSSLVVSFLRNKKMDEAHKLFRWMLGNRIKPDGLACNIFLKQLCLEGQVLDGFEYYAEMEKTDCLASVDSDIYHILLAGLCQQGHLVEAARLMEVMFKGNIKLKAPYTDVIAQSLKNSGQKQLALQLRSILENVESKDVLSC